MKKLILTLLIGTPALPVQAQLFSGEALGTAALGGLIGGIVGHNSGRHTAEGIGIGAGAGLLLGALAHQSRPQPYYGEVVVAGPYAPGYAVRPNHAVTGAVLGGIAGGVIGHNIGRHTAEGVAIGAASGLVLGAVAEQNAQRQVIVQHVQPVPASVVVQTTPVTTVTTSPRQQVANTATLNTSYSVPASPMAAANSLFGR